MDADYGFTVLNENKVKKITETNPIEMYLKNNKSLSLRQLKNKTGIPLKSVKYHIYTSNNIEDTPSWVHGSGRSKIRCFRYTPETKGYHERKIKKNQRIVTEPSESPL
jgi:hypothetical protein